MGLGDSLMDSAAARRAQRTDPRKVRILLGHKGLVWSEVWDHNPRIAGPRETGDFQIVYGRDRVTNMRPYHTAKTPERWTYNLDFRPEVGEIYLTDEEREFGSRYQNLVIIEPHIKRGASPNKQWPRDNWEALCAICKQHGITPTHMGPLGTRPINGARLIITPTFRLACAVLARAKAFVLHESGLHHAAAALGLRGVVIFGGFTPVELTGYMMHKNLGVSLENACGNRLPCKHCEKEMASITPERVFDELRSLLCTR